MIPADFTSFPALQDLVLQWSVVCPSCIKDSTTDSTSAREAERDDASQNLVRALPDSLRMILIIDCSREQRPERLESALDGLALAKSLGRFPHLRHVGCEVDRMTGTTQLPLSRRLWRRPNSVRDMFGAAGVRVDYALGWLGPGLPVPTAAQVAAVSEQDLIGCTIRRPLYGDDDYVGMPLPGEEEDDDL
ncbi:hypothetical protein PG997_010948 [Apiospora hydei]|uniref:Uncharacterized protein n=1 Tax=Apiospora hydei TaxID=1337664 RepID=A0ABR1VKI5_9PEZI